MEVRKEGRKEGRKKRRKKERKEKECKEVEAVKREANSERRKVWKRE